MKIATFNVNSIRARMPILIQWMLKNRPDAICLQETKVQDIEFPAEQIEEIGYNCYFKGRKKYNGVAILTQKKADNVNYGLDTQPNDFDRLIAVKIGKLNIVNTYVPQGYEVNSEKFIYKLNWFSRLRDFFDKNYNPSDLLLWTGDLNVAPTELDVYKPEEKGNHVCFCPQVRDALTNVMEWGFEDVFRKFNKNGQLYSFWDYRFRASFDRNFGWRIDHFMATKPLAEKTLACRIDKEPRTMTRPSDHTPVIVELAL